MSRPSMSEMGVAVNPLPGGEIVPALDRGLIDAAEFNNASSDRVLGFAEPPGVLHFQNPDARGDLRFDRCLLRFRLQLLHFSLLLLHLKYHALLLNLLLLRIWLRRFSHLIQHFFAVR